MPYDIEIDVDPAFAAVDLEKVRQAVKATLCNQRVETAELAVLLTNDERLHALNQQFLGIDKPTDVLSFGSGEEALAAEAGQMPYLGDIAIAVPYAAAQAAAAGHPLLAELQLLAVHGTLHLLGYDHGSAEEKSAMWAVQQAILEELGLAGVAPTEA